MRDLWLTHGLRLPHWIRTRTDITLAYIPFDELCEHYDALCKFGDDREALKKIARV